MNTLVHIVRPWPRGSKPPWFKVASLPQDAPPPALGRDGAVKFSAAHVENGEHVFFSRGGGMKRKPFTKHVRDRAYVHGTFYEIERGVVDGVRHGHPEGLTLAAEIQTRIEAEKARHEAEMVALCAARQDALEDAYIRGRKVRVEEIRPAPVTTEP